MLLYECEAVRSATGPGVGLTYPLAYTTGQMLPLSAANVKLLPLALLPIVLSPSIFSDRFTGSVVAAFVASMAHCVLSHRATTSDCPTGRVN